MSKVNSNNLDYKWEWLELDQWKCYDSKYQNIFNEALKTNKNLTEFEINNQKFEIDFEGKMVQRNLKTLYERSIRFSILNNSDDDKTDKKKCYIYWQWLNDYKKWSNYPAYITIELENNYIKYTESNLSSSFFKLKLKETDTNYQIDFNKMSQTNEKSGFSRRIRRIAEATNLEHDDKIVQEKIKKESKEEDEENNRPSSNLRKRSSLTASNEPALKTNIKKLKTEIKEEDEEIQPKIQPNKKSSRPIQESDSEEEIKSAKSGSKAKTSKSTKKLKSEKADADTNNEATTSKENSDIPLDEHFIEMHGSSTYKIYREGPIIYDAMLNQTNLQFNNNKYYLIQLLEKNGTKNYSVWLRWGRVGKTGQFTFENYGTDLDGAKNFFCKKFLDKTKNDWASKDSFEKYPGKYDLVEKDYSSNEKSSSSNVTNDINVDKPKIEIPPSKLDKNLQNLIELICNVTEMENLLKEMKFDAEKAPLGKLSKNQIKAGYSALKEIEDHILKNKFGSGFIQANNDFYTRIPHSFGMKTPPLIRTAQQLREKMKLLEVLDEIEVAIKALNQESNISNPIDRHYEQLECSLTPIDHNDKMFALIEQYLIKNHAPTHNMYKLKLLEVYKAEKKSEIEKFKDCGNRMLLWHGSRLTNWAGILSQGLRIAPPEAPVTGYMFGKGCYFSDCSSKSANYCYTNSIKKTGLLSLSEVSLGEFNELKQADNNADKLPKGKMSTKGVGKSEPNESEWVKLDDGCVIPIGKLKNKVDSKDANSYSLLYNEYIVYDVSQIKLRYLVKVEFDYEDD